MRPVLGYERIYIEHPEFYGQDMVKRHVDRYRWATQFIKNRFKILDLCCGTGYGSKILAKSGRSVVGVDKDHNAIEYARTHYNLKNLVFYEASVFDINDILPDETFNTVTCIEAIEHFNAEDAERLLLMAQRKLCKGGKLILTTPDITQSKRNNKYHLHEFSFAEICELVSKYFYCQYFKKKNDFIYLMAEKNGYN